MSDSARHIINPDAYPPGSPEAHAYEAGQQVLRGLVALIEAQQPDAVYTFIVSAPIAGSDLGVSAMASTIGPLDLDGIVTTLIAHELMQRRDRSVQ